MSNIAKSTDDIVYIFTDGALSLHKPTRAMIGGWGAHIQYREHVKQISGAKVGTSTQEMEFEAILQAISILTNIRDRRAVVYCDNQWCVNTVLKSLSLFRATGCWPVSCWAMSLGGNQNLKTQVRTIVERSPRHVFYKWIKGHADIQGNVCADGLAKAARQAKRAEWETQQDVGNQDAVWS